MKTAPFILNIIGKSDSGKTTLILKLLPLLKKHGYNVAVAKHCPCGFDLDVEGKDSWKFAQAGSEGILVDSGNQFAVIRPKEEAYSIKEKLKNCFVDFDIVLMEGYNRDVGIDKIQIIRSTIGGTQDISGDVIAYVSDMKFDTDKPVFQPDDIAGVVSFIERQMATPHFRVGNV